MILDKNLMFSEDQDLAQVAGSYASTNVIDLQDVKKGEGTPIEVLCQITETFTSGGAATLTVALQTDDNASFSSATTYTIESTVALASLVAGKQFAIRILPNNMERYARMYYTIGTATTTAGKMSSGLGSDLQTNMM